MAGPPSCPGVDRGGTEPWPTRLEEEEEKQSLEAARFPGGLAPWRRESWVRRGKVRAAEIVRACPGEGLEMSD